MRGQKQVIPLPLQNMKYNCPWCPFKTWKEHYAKGHFRKHMRLEDFEAEAEDEEKRKRPWPYSWIDHGRFPTKQELYPSDKE